MDWFKRWEELKGSSGGAWSATVETPEHLIVYIGYAITTKGIDYVFNHPGFRKALESTPLDVWEQWLNKARGPVATAAPLPDAPPKQCDKGHVMVGNATPMCYRCYTGL